MNPRNGCFFTPTTLHDAVNVKREGNPSEKKKERSAGYFNNKREKS